MTKAITNFQDEHRFLSNFWPSPIKWKSAVWPTVEHAYQAAKSADPIIQEFVRCSRTPGIAKRRGRQVKARDDWDKVKLGIMRELVTKKFTQNKDLAKLLKETGDAELIEGNTWGDTFWGVCRGQGENHLGKILMEIRDGL